MPRVTLGEDAQAESEGVGAAKNPFGSMLSAARRAPRVRERRERRRLSEQERERGERERERRRC
jgi:hypothetical protein